MLKLKSKGKPPIAKGINCCSPHRGQGSLKKSMLARSILLFTWKVGVDRSGEVRVFSEHLNLHLEQLNLWRPEGLGCLHRLALIVQWYFYEEVRVKFEGCCHPQVKSWWVHTLKLSRPESHILSSHGSEIGPR